MVDFGSLFSIEQPIEIIVRGTAMYWFLFLLFRFVLRRDTGSIGIADILLLMLIADASQNAMSGDYKSISEGFLLVATIAGWNYLLDWLSFHFPALRTLLVPGPLMLIRDGRLQRGNMRQELVTISELKSKLREQGIEKVSDVKAAFMESNGEISVITFEPQGNGGGGGQPAATPEKGG